MNLFEFEDYQAFLKADIKENSSGRGYLTILANAAGCQKSYLSQVIRGVVHFTPEHAMRLSAFWNFTEREIEYFIQLVHFGRTSFQPLRDKIRGRLQELRDERENLAQRYKQDSIKDVHAQAEYYSSWVPSALHVAVDIDDLRMVEDLARYFGVPLNLVKSQLEILEGLGLLVKKGQHWVSSGQSLHLPKNSVFTSMNHQNWRARAVMDSQNSRSSGIHYTSVQSLSKSDFETIKELLLKCIDQQRKIVAPSKAETVACFSCDWFRA